MIQQPEIVIPSSVDMPRAMRTTTTNQVPIYTLRADDFEVVVDYNDLREEKGEKCQPKLVRSPSNVHHMRVSPQAIDYIIEQKVLFND
jgi:hypothetical protein